MNDWSKVNGAKIEKSFLAQNIREAKSYTWEQLDVDRLVGHVHCMICGIAIDEQLLKKTSIFKSSGGYLCDYCAKSFLEMKSRC